MPSTGELVDTLSALKYLGIDWMAMLFTFAAILRLGNKSRSGFALMMLGNSCWVVIGVLTGSVAMIVANAVFLLTNARGWYRWRASHQEVASLP